MELEIKETARNGDGVGRVRGTLVFVKGGQVGQTVKVRITKIAARHAYAELIQP
jgi:predicted RNA-binding protein with TRAM domain